MNYGRVDIPAHLCPICRTLHRENLTRIRSGIAPVRSADVQTWCRVCGRPAWLKIALDYATCVKKFQTLDQQLMMHEGGDHFEEGGWGILWRLDNVLAKAFPVEYANDPFKPYWLDAPWHPDLAMDEPIDIIVPGLKTYIPLAERDGLRRKVRDAINTEPRTREQLELAFGEVWDEETVNNDFEVLGDVSPFMLVLRLRDGMTGALLYQEYPRLYWHFATDHII